MTPESSAAEPLSAPKPRRRGRRIVLWILASIGTLLVVAIVGVVVWSQVGVMGAAAEPLAAVRADDRIVITDDGGAIVLSPASGAAEVGLVYIPGAKVDAWAYASKLSGIVVEQGVTVVITKPWLNLAFFDLRPLEAFTDLAPDVEVWMVGGHSLGGVRACALAEDADALVLFASYCANDLSETDLPVLSIAGSEDGLSTPDKIAEARSLLPDDASMIEIDGASHASFGDYGAQAGDGTPTISDDAMIAELTEAVGIFATALRP